jgi:hypothetical protein
MQMCADGDLVHTSLNDDERARTVYDLISRHLRNVRSAVFTGALLAGQPNSAWNCRRDSSAIYRSGSTAASRPMLQA